MKQETLEEAARKNACPKGGKMDIAADFIYTVFKKGALWYQNAVWHDTTEKPKLGELIIVEVYGKLMDYGKYQVGDTIHPKARWAYMKDLLPTVIPTKMILNE